jgi:dephospho-CoA kinase
MIIGLTGPMGSGKSTASEILQERGFTRFSFSDEVKKEALNRGIPISERALLQDIGDDLRKKYGLEILAKRLFSSFKNSNFSHAVFEGIRNPGELKYIQQMGGFVIGVDAPVDLRFERVRNRKNPYDPTTLEEFKLNEQRDRGVNQQSFGQNADECLKLSDTVIINNGTFLEFSAKILDALTLLKG